MSRPPHPIPEALVRHLEHSYATGHRWSVQLVDEQDRADAADLRRACRRAGYRLFPGRLVHCKVTEELVTYWMTDRPNGGNA